MVLVKQALNMTPPNWESWQKDTYKMNLNLSLLKKVYDLDLTEHTQGSLCKSSIIDFLQQSCPIDYYWSLPYDFWNTVQQKLHGTGNALEVVTQFWGILHSLLLDVVHAGCSLKLMLDWAWDRVVEIKNQLDQLCKFAHSHSLLLEHDNFCGAQKSWFSCIYWVIDQWNARVTWGLC